jgi:hypothetical protein
LIEIQVVAHWELSHARLPSLVIKKGALLSSLPFLAWFGCWSPPSNCSPLEKVGCPTRTLATIQFQRHALDPAAVRWEGGNQEICFARPGLPWFGSVLPFVFCGCRNNKTYGATTAIICSLFVRIFPSHRGGPDALRRNPTIPASILKSTLWVIMRLKMDSVLSFTIPGVV